jgi:5-methylcytosine-specific restriction protein A
MRKKVWNLSSEYFILDPQFTDPARIRRERDRSRLLKKTNWWQSKIQKGICYYCEQKVGSQALTMDHIIPLARGGQSTKGNLVPSCQDCNSKKKLKIPVESLLEEKLKENH